MTKTDKHSTARATSVGLYEMMNCALYHPRRYWLMMVMIRCHMYRVVKKFLGIH